MASEPIFLPEFLHNATGFVVHVIASHGVRRFFGEAARIGRAVDGVTASLHAGHAVAQSVVGDNCRVAMRRRDDGSCNSGFAIDAIFAHVLGGVARRRAEHSARNGSSDGADRPARDGAQNGARNRSGSGARIAAQFAFAAGRKIDVIVIVADFVRDFAALGAQNAARDHADNPAPIGPPMAAPTSPPEIAPAPVPATSPMSPWLS